MSQIGNLVVTLSADIANYLRSMASGARETESHAGRIRAAMESISAATPAIGVAALAAGTALAVMVKESIDAADNLRDMSQKTGVAIETLNGLGFAAGQAGGDLESVASAAGKMNKAVTEAAGGNKEASDAFDALGISITDAEGNLKSADVLIAEVADQFEKYADGPEKSAIALRLFGKAGADMIPLLNDGGDALRENIEYAKQYSGLTTELADASDNFNDTMGKLTLQQKSFSNSVASAVLPILQKVADETLNAAEQSDKFSLASTAIRTVLETFVVVGAEVAFMFKGVGTEIGGMIAQLDRLARMDIKGFSAISEAMKADAERARIEHDKFIKDILDRSPPAVKPPAEEKPDKDKPSAPRLPGKGSDDATKAIFGNQLKAIEDAYAKERDIASFHAQFIEGLRAQDIVDLETTQAFKKSSIEEGLSSTLRNYDAQIAILEKQRAASKKESEQVEITGKIKEKQALKDRARIDAMQANALLELEISKQRFDEDRRLEDERLKAVQQNEADVMGIAMSLETALEAETAAYNERLSALMVFRDEQLENEKRANALIEKENKRHGKVLAEMQAANDLQSLAMASDVAGQIYQVLKNAGKEKTALAKSLFLAQKAIAVAEIIINTEKGASAALGFGPFGIPMASIIRGLGYASAGIVAGTAIAEVSAEGGYDIPAGVNPVVQTHEQEMILPKEHANVIRGLARNGGAGGGMKLTVVNTGTPQRVVQTQKVSDEEWAAIVEDAVNATAAQISDPNSRTSRALGRSYQMQRSR